VFFLDGTNDHDKIYEKGKRGKAGGGTVSYTQKASRADIQYSLSKPFFEQNP